MLRYPYIESPSSSPINQRFSLYVKLLIESPEDGRQVINISDEFPEVEIVLRVQGCDIEGSNTQVIHVEWDEVTEERFVLIPRQLNEQHIQVDFYQEQRKIATVRGSIIIQGKELKNRKKTQTQIQTTLEIKDNISVPPPDLELCVQLDLRDRRTLYFTLHSTKSEIDFHHKKVGKVISESSPEQKMRFVYHQLGHLAEQVSRKGEPIDLNSPVSSFQDNQKRANEERLISVGNQLWDELIPDELKQQYWQFKSVVTSLLITSDEPWIPWEIIKPYKFNNEKEEQDPFWCEQFAMSRWLSGPGTADDFPTELVITVAPTNTNLLCLQQEVTFFQQLNNLRSSVSCLPTISNVSELQNYIRKPEFSILHFACHGMFDRTFPNDSAIQLTDGVLRPSDIRIKFTNLRPLIFINACHGGRVGFSFTRIGGWAERFVNARVGVFIGAMWEVNDELALQFAQTFYTALLQENLTIAQAFQKSREAIRKVAPYNSTWLAYSLYADPEARIKEAS